MHGNFTGVLILILGFGFFEFDDNMDAIAMMTWEVFVESADFPGYVFAEIVVDARVNAFYLKLFYHGRSLLSILKNNVKDHTYHYTPPAQLSCEASQYN